jgi:CheY-like chemotaxis protein
MGQTIMAKILLVDDCEFVIKMVSLFLSYNHHTVETELSGLQGLERALSGNFDLIITDLNLEDLSGLELARSYKQAGHTNPVLLCTTEDCLQGLDHGQLDGIVDYFCTKELDPLLAQVETALLKQSQTYYPAISY